METDGSLPHSQQTATCPCYESDQFISLPYSISWRPALILFSHLYLGFPNSFFPSGFLINISFHLSSPPYARMLSIQQDKWYLFDIPQEYHIHTVFNLEGFGASISGTDMARLLFFMAHWFCPHSVLACCFRDMRKKGIIFIYNINSLFYITKRGCVYCALRNEFLTL